MISPLKQRVVISGVGVLAANGNGKDAFWRTLLDGVSGIGPLTFFEADGLPCRIAGEVKDFDYKMYFKPEMKARRMGRFTHLAVAAATMALRDAKLDPEYVHSIKDIPIVMGVSTSAMDLLGEKATPFTAVYCVPHAAASAIAYTLSLDAKLTTLSDGCASSLDAIAYAADLIRRRVADVVLCGGAESAITRYVFEGFAKSRRLSTRNDSAETASRPFDKDRDGGIIAEGAGVLVMENYEHARARGAEVYSEVLGYGHCADPVNSGEGVGLSDAMAEAVVNSSLDVQDIYHISAHGPSDPEMDLEETQAIRRVFGKCAYRIPVTSIKGATGNPMAVGGVLQTVAAALSIKHSLVPPVANLMEPGEGCDLDYVAGAPRRGEIVHALINSHGFGRSNTSLVLRRLS